MTIIRVLIVDDHAIIREGLRTMTRLLSELEVVGEATSGEEAVEMAGRLQPDLVLMDVMMPGVDGLAATALIVREQPWLPVIMLTTFADAETVMGALRAGARGYLLKDLQLEVLGDAIHTVLAGKPYLHPEAQRQLVAAAARPDDPAEQLTSREQQVLELVAEGKTNRQIGDLLAMTEKTASVHVSNILRKLGLSSRTQAAIYIKHQGAGTLTYTKGRSA